MSQRSLPQRLSLAVFALGVLSIGGAVLGSLWAYRSEGLMAGYLIAVTLGVIGVGALGGGVYAYAFE